MGNGEWGIVNGLLTLAFLQLRFSIENILEKGRIFGTIVQLNYKEIMRQILAIAALTTIMASPVLAQEESSQSSLIVVYPKTAEFTTESPRTFIIGSAPPDAEVLVNGRSIERSPAGHFAPSFPLEMGENIFTFRYKEEEKVIKVTRVSNEPVVPQGVAFAEGTLAPKVDIARMPGELICFSAIATPDAEVSVRLGSQTIPMLSQSQVVNLPSNLSVLTGDNQPTRRENFTGLYQGCAKTENPGELGKPTFQLTKNGRTISQEGPGQVTIMSPTTFEVAEVTVDGGIARTGPSTSHSRLTPLPKGTRALITGREGEFLRLDYGAWIKAEETKIFTDAIPPRSFIRSLLSRPAPNATEVFFPLQAPVPVSVEQDDNSFSITIHNTIAQTDTIRFDDDPYIERLDWQPILSPTVQGEQSVKYTFRFKNKQQWGYKLRYEGTTLVLTLRHPPAGVGRNRLLRDRPLAGMNILIDPGHGSSEDLGAVGPNGYPEKDVVLTVSKLFRDELVERGASVYMTREGDDDLWPKDRVEMIEAQEPDLALSVHYNALPNYGDAMNTKGIGTFWYHPQAHGLAVFLHNYLTEQLRRPSYGVFWNNLALARPTIAPSVLLELGFMINPYEFEWIMDPEEQQKLAEALADGVVEWVERAN
jgi:N-acetylmuramoyl-L-alanine amidase